MSQPCPFMKGDQGRTREEWSPTFLGTALRQAYDYWQDQPGFPNPELQGFKVPGPKSAVPEPMVTWRRLVSGATFRRFDSSPVPWRADVLETGDMGGD